MTKSSKRRAKGSQAAKAAAPLNRSELYKQQRANEEALKQTLQYLQDRIKRQPELYKKEFMTHFDTFKAKLIEYKENPAKKSEDLIHYTIFFAHISLSYKETIVEFLSSELLNILQQYYSILNPENRMAMVTSLKILRGKNLVQPYLIIPVFLKLFKCKDKELRSFLHSAIINDLKKLNLTHKNHGVNKKLQNFIYEMIKDQNETASKRAVSVMIELYKRKIWNDDKTVNVIAEGCLHDNPKLVAAACKFFLVLDYDYDTDTDGEDTSDEEKEKKILLGQYKGTKRMTKGRISKVDKVIKQHKRKEKRKNKVKFSTDFLPIDLIYDAQSFSEKLFNKLRKCNDRYEVKLLLMRLISRMIGRHKLLLLQFYPHLIRYLQSHEKEKVGEIFAMIIESCHELIPPEEIKPIIEKIISNFITEYCNNQHITIGLNSIREILLRMPLALDESQIEYLVAFRTFRNASVQNAAKSLINYFRDVCPNLLPKKFRGRFTKLDEDNRKENMVYGMQKINYNVDGIELLEKAEGVADGVNLATTRVLDDADLRKIRILKMRKAIKQVAQLEDSVNEEEDDDEDEEDILSDDEIGSEDGDGEEQEEGESEELEEEEGDEIDSDDDLLEGESEDEEEGSEEQSDVSNEEEVKAGTIQKEKPSKKKKDAAVVEEDSEFEDIASEDMEDSEQDGQNPHGFVFSHHLDTYKRSKRERIEENEKAEDKLAFKDKFKKRDKKKGGTTNKKKLKSKPFMMLKPKKVKRIQENYESVRHKVKRIRVQLGKFKKNQKQKLDSKKKKFMVK